MADLLNLNDYRRVQNLLVAQAVAEIEALLSTVDRTDPYVVRTALEAFLPDLVQEYGSAVATLAADRYDALRDLARVPGRYTATPAAPPATDAMVARLRQWGLWPHFAQNDLSAAVSRTSTMLDEWIKQPGRDTVTVSARNDPAVARVARVPTGTSTCAFCIAMAGRGAVYLSEESAGKIDPEHNRFHGGCDCATVVTYEGRPSPDIPPHYDDYARQYEKARDAAGTSDIRAVLAKMREQHIDATGSPLA